LVLKLLLSGASCAPSSLLHAALGTACFCVHATLSSRFAHDPRRRVAR
jgi:hypothetical protein